MERIAFIDLGSNSVRFVVSEINNKSYKLVYQQKESIRLSEGMSAQNKLTDEAIKRALQTLKAFAEMAKAMDVKRTIAVATAAVRLATNGPDFIKEVFDLTGIKISCISGEEEARLGYLGVVNTIDVQDCIIFDLGGASIEVTLVRNRRIVESHSFPMGALTVTELFQTGKELTPSEISEMKAFVTKKFASKKWLENTKLPVIGIGGTIRNIGKMDQRRQNYPITKLHNYVLPLQRFKELYEEVSSKSLEQRKKISGLSTERADIIIAGLVIIDALVRYTKASMLKVSGCGLREGLFYDYYGKYHHQGNVLLSNVLQQSAENVLTTMPNHDEVHTKYVARLTDALFIQWQPLHQFPPRVGQLLHVAALLHDIGKVINYYSHARHSAYMILNANLYGLTHEEQAECAFMAAFSHGASGKIPRGFLNAQLLTEDDWKLVRKASIMLALAEVFDEEHEQCVLFTDSVITKEEVKLNLHVRGDTNVEMLSVVAQKLIKQFKKDYGRKLTINYVFEDEPYPS